MVVPVAVLSKYIAESDASKISFSDVITAAIALNT